MLLRKLLVCVNAFLTLQTALAVGAAKPNILILLFDDLGYSDLGCYGGEIDTPHIDALARGGVRFESFYNSARCCPSRASLMTGLYPAQAGIASFTTRNPSPQKGPAYLGRLNDQCVTLAEVIKPAGYSCYFVGKWHMHTETGPIKRGFDEFYGYTTGYAQDQWQPDKYERLPAGRPLEIDRPAGKFYATDIFNDYALEFLKQGQQKNRPWFLFLSHSSPHFPVQSPADTVDQYYQRYLRGWDVLRKERFARMQQIGLAQGSHWQLTERSMVPIDKDAIANGYPGQPNPAWDNLGTDRQRDLARRMAVFAAMVDHVDQGVGKIVRHLEATQELDNTLILILSDNGACYEWGPFGFDGPSRRGITKLHTGAALQSMGGPGTHHSYGSAWANLGNTPFRLYKHFTHEGGICTPFIVHWPQGIQSKGQWVRDPGHLIDVLPTLRAAAGADYPATLRGHRIQPEEGVNLLPAIRGKDLQERSLYFEHQLARALRRGKWKIVWGKRMPQKAAWELYKLDKDRSEQHNLAAQRPRLVSRLAAEWEAWATRVGIDGFQKNKTGPPQRTQRVRTHDSPNIAQQSFTVVVETRADDPQGVVLAQGGQEHGYALHFVRGKPAFDLRVEGTVTRLLGPSEVQGLVRLQASLSEQTISLLINDDEPLIRSSPGLIPVQPQDPLDLGQDTRTAAGEYAAPNPFNGTIIYTRVDTAGRPPAVAPVMSRAEIEAGLASHDRALFIKEDWIRDPYITLGPDDWFYLTGTTPNPEDPRERSDPYNTGLGEGSMVGTVVQIWRSKDLIAWEHLGTPFTLQNDSWHRDPGKRVWAPEVHWLGDRWALVHCPGNKANFALSSGSELKGPWTHAMGKKLGRKHDPSLFKDGNSWYMLWANTLIAPLSADWRSFTAAPVRIDPAGSRPDPRTGKPMSRIGHEGATMAKIGKKYVHFGTAWSTDRGRRGSYNLYYCTADRITGPYGPRKFAGRFLGHGTPFQTRDGKWWCTAFYNANVPPVSREGIRQRDLSITAQTINQRGTTIVPLEVRTLDDGDIYIRAKDPAYAMPGPDEAQRFADR